MAVYSKKINISSNGFTDIIDISDEVNSAIRKSGIENGICVVACPSSTSAVSSIEYESGCIDDLQRALEKIAPQDDYYKHNERWHDGNGFSHVRSALMKPNFAIPVAGGSAVLGTWQQVIFIDFDNKSRRREITVQIVGE